MKEDYPALLGQTTVKPIARLTYGRTKCDLALLKPITARRVEAHHLISTDSQMLLNLTQSYSNLD